MLGSFSIVFLALCASWEADLDLKKIKKERSLWEGRRQAGNKQWELTNRKSVEAYHRCSQRQIDGSLFCFLGSSACSFLGKQNTLVCWLALGWATPTFTKLFRSLIKENVWKMCSEWKFNSSFPFSVFVILRLLCSHLVFEGKKKYTDWDVWRTIKGGGPWGPSVPARCASCRAWFYPIASSADEVASRSLSDVLPWRRSNGLLPPPPPPCLSLRTCAYSPLLQSGADSLGVPVGEERGQGWLHLSMWWALKPSTTGDGGRGKKTRVEWENSGCFWLVMWDSELCWTKDEEGAK